EFENYKDKHGFVIGGLEDVPYTEYTVQLTPGSTVFVYTDGVPEAMDAKEELFGRERMLKALNRDKEADPKEILSNVREAVDDFVQDAEQFDDLTMLCFTYLGNEGK
ncbi:MAG: serine/threonine-protein phosphatase, partial [Lachnospiraceae bacterium]|nr:serine/threonine-protein phosphatase [Lachnospiraceae bacterium]